MNCVKLVLKSQRFCSPPLVLHSTRLALRSSCFRFLHCCSRRDQLVRCHCREPQNAQQSLSLIPWGRQDDNGVTDSDQKHFQLQVGHWNIDTNCVPVSYPVTWHGRQDGIHQKCALSHSTQSTCVHRRFCLRSLRCLALSCLSSRCSADTAQMQVFKCTSSPSCECMCVVYFKNYTRM